MKFAKFIPALTILLALLAGCAGQKPQKTATQEGVERWNMARAGVLYSLAKEQYEAGNLDDARKTLTNASKYAPTHPQIRLLSAKVSIEQGQLELAESELNVLRELDSKSGEADYLTGVINQRWQKPEVAYQCYSRAAQKNPNELAYLLAEAEMLVQLDQSAKALAMLREKLNFFENSPAIRDAVGQLLAQEGKFDEAVTVLRQASSLAPDEQGIREHYGLALYYAKQYREAAAVLERIVTTAQKTPTSSEEKNPKPSYANRADIRTALGECQMEIDRPRDARDNFEAASQLQPENVTVWLNLAKVALRLNDLKRAELSLKKAMTIDAKVADAHLLMGYLLLQQNKLSDALASFKKASSLDERDAVSVCMQGLVLEKMGRSSEAVRYYSQALKIKPNDEMATALLAKVQVQE